MRMPPRIRFEPLLAPDRSLDFLRWDCSLFHQTVRYDRSDGAMEEVQDSVMHSPKADAQFVNPVAQEIGFGTPKLVTHFP
jgi:hypothetical protein